MNNRNTRTRCETWSKLTIKTPERRQWRLSGVFIVNFEHTSHFVPVLLLLTFFTLPRSVLVTLSNIKVELFAEIINGWMPLFSQELHFRYLKEFWERSCCFYASKMEAFRRPLTYRKRSENFLIQPFLAEEVLYEGLVKNTFQQTFTCSKSIIQALKKEMCSKLTTKTSKRRQCRRPVVFIANFEQISYLFLLFLLLTLNNICWNETFFYWLVEKLRQPCWLDLIKVTKKTKTKKKHAQLRSASTFHILTI